MTIGYLVDTNIFSEFLRPSPDSRIVSCFQAAEDQISTASVVWHELIFGVQRMPASKKRSRIEAFLFDVLLPTIPILTYDTKAAQWHGEERAYLVATGQTPSFADGQIASIAATNNLIVVTRNTADFANFRDIAVENWIAG